MAKKSNPNFTFNDFLEKLKDNSISKGKNVETIEERKYYLIVCEGERTEPLYFNYFQQKLPKGFLDTIEIKGEGDNTVNIVRKALSLREKREKDTVLPNYDEVWAIYDKDDFPNERYHEAISLCEEFNINSGHSNQSFELWYVLHFQFLQSALHRSDYIKILSKILGFKYEKNDSKIVDIINTKGNVKQAIKWAIELDKLHEDSSESNSCPSTKVYKLVESLLNYMKHYH